MKGRASTTVGVVRANCSVGSAAVRPHERCREQFGEHVVHVRVIIVLFSWPLGQGRRHVGRLMDGAVGSARSDGEEEGRRSCGGTRLLAGECGGEGGEV